MLFKHYYSQNGVQASARFVFLIGRYTTGIPLHRIAYVVMDSVKSSKLMRVKEATVLTLVCAAMMQLDLKLVLAKVGLVLR